jgi:hypothetical protein
MRDEANDRMEMSLLNGMTRFWTLTRFYGRFTCSGIHCWIFEGGFLVIPFHCREMYPYWWLFTWLFVVVAPSVVPEHLFVRQRECDGSVLGRFEIDSVVCGHY